MPRTMLKPVVVEQPKKEKPVTKKAKKEEKKE